MRVFLCWSGPLSKAVGDILVNHLGPIYDNISFFFSENDIMPGNMWINKLLETLKASDCCIVCTTRQSLTSPWVNFEAGAMAAATHKNPGVTALLIDVLPGELSGSHPLSLFQSTLLEQRSFLKLMTLLYNRMLGNPDGEPINDRSLQKRLHTAWVAISSEISMLLSAPQEPLPTAKPDLRTDDLEGVHVDANGVSYLTWEAHIDLIRQLYAKLNRARSLGGYNFNTVVGMNQGGLLTANLLARMYGRDRQAYGIFSDRMDRETSFFDSEFGRISNRYVIEALKDNRSGQILVVDCIARGDSSLLAAREYLREMLPPEKTVRYAALILDRSCSAGIVEYSVMQADTRQLLFPFQYAIS